VASMASLSTGAGVTCCGWGSGTRGTTLNGSAMQKQHNHGGANSSIAHVLAPALASTCWQIRDEASFPSLGRLAWEGNSFGSKKSKILRGSRGAGWPTSWMTAAGGGEGGSASGTMVKLSAATTQGRKSDQPCICDGCAL
jgi:hypothetical protein